MPTPGNGNGGVDTVYRVREGIERFLITDINNPAASAKARSEIFIMLDMLGTGASPSSGYPGKGPVTRSMANIIGEASLGWGD